jgi:hypothetical protein
MEVEGTETIVSQGLSIPLLAGRVREGLAFTSLGGRPAGVRRRVGRGEVVFVAFPLDLPGIDAAAPPEALWRAILGARAEEETPDPRRNEDEPRVLFESIEPLLADLSPGRLPVNATTLAWGGAVLLVYGALIGPLDFLWRKRRRTLRRGWVSFLAILGIFTGLGVLWGNAASPREDRLRHLVFVDEGAVQAFSALRAGGGHVYTVEGKGAISPVGGPSVAAHDEAPVLEPPARLRLPLPALAVQGLASSRLPGPGDPGVTCVWTDRDRLLGEVAVTGPFAVRACVIVSKESVFPIGDLAAGERQAFDLGKAGGVPFSSWLREVAKGDGSDEDDWSRRFPRGREAEALSFYQEYREVTRGAHSLFAPEEIRVRLRTRGLDLSPLLVSGARVFLGRFDADPEQWRVEPSAEVEVRGVVRVVLP